MPLAPITDTPRRNAYDVIIVGGAMIGSSCAWWLSANPDFGGSILVVERDPSYEYSSTARTNSCIRQQFSNELNIRISQFGVAFLRSFRERLGGDREIPDIVLHSFGYMYLAGDERMASVLRENQALQASLGAGTRMLTPEQILKEYPFYNLDGVVLGSHNPVDEGYFDGATMFDWWRRTARANGAEYVSNEVIAIGRSGQRVESITLASGQTVQAGVVVNATGPRAAATARMAGLLLPVEPRRRYSFVFDAAEPLDRALPLTIDPSGVHVRSDGRYYLAGCPPDDDPAAAFDDFEMDHDIWERKVWPAIAHRIPAFEAVKVINSWVGHYAYNTLDHNAVVGPHPEVGNFLFANGFSGHGFQQSPAVGRGIAELIAYGGYRSLDLSPLGYDRIVRGVSFLEKAII
jgi:glycine/D-amino acid oxidase-like deaminating enzyme